MTLNKKLITWRQYKANETPGNRFTYNEDTREHDQIQQRHQGTGSDTTKTPGNRFRYNKDTREQVQIQRRHQGTGSDTTKTPGNRFRYNKDTREQVQIQQIQFHVVMIRPSLLQQTTLNVLLTSLLRNRPTSRK